MKQLKHFKKGKNSWAKLLRIKPFHSSDLHNNSPNCLQRREYQLTLAALQFLQC